MDLDLFNIHSRTSIPIETKFQNKLFVKYIIKYSAIVIDYYSILQYTELH